MRCSVHENWHGRSGVWLKRKLAMIHTTGTQAVTYDGASVADLQLWFQGNVNHIQKERRGRKITIIYKYDPYSFYFKASKQIKKVSMKEASTSNLCLVTVHQKKSLWKDLMWGDIYVMRTLRLSFVGQQTVEHMDLFPAQISSSTLPLGERKRVGWCCWCWWWVNTPLQPKTQSLLSCWNLRAYLLVPSCGPRSRFALALFQVWEVKCKQFTDLLWLGRAMGFSWEECNLNTTSQGGCAARWSIHAYCVRA